MEWEYKVYTTGFYPNTLSVIQALDSLGLDRWELISITQDRSNDMYFYHFKRPKQKPTVDVI